MATYQKKSENPPILLHMDWGEMLLKLKDADVGYIIKGMLLHRLGKECESREVDPILEGVLTVMNTQSDREAKAYVERCEKNALKRKGVTSNKNSQPQLTTVNHSQPQLTEVNNNNYNNSYNDNYSNNNNYNDNNNINTSFSSNEEKDVEKETEKMSDQPDEETGKEVDPTRERGNPNFDLRRSYHEVMERKARERLEETGSKWLSDEYLAKNYPESFPHLAKQYNRPNIDAPNII